MGRKTTEAESADRLIAASAAAAGVVSGDLAACSRMLRFYLDAAAAAEDEDVRAEYIHCAAELAGAVAKLSAALAQIRGETRQLISVRRERQMHPNAPQNAPKIIGY